MEEITLKIAKIVEKGQELPTWLNGSIPKLDQIDLVMLNTFTLRQNLAKPTGFGDICEKQ